jgi:hypothetical protein
LRFNNKNDFSLLAVPGVGSTTMVDLGMAYCQNRPLQDVFYIGEMDQDDDTPAEAESPQRPDHAQFLWGGLFPLD